MTMMIYVNVVLVIAHLWKNIFSSVANACDTTTHIVFKSDNTNQKSVIASICCYGTFFVVVIVHTLTDISMGRKKVRG